MEILFDEQNLDKYTFKCAWADIATDDTQFKDILKGSIIFT